MNRQQQDLDRAIKHVQQVTAEPKETCDIYGGLCHTFPVLVCTNGLCQTLAFFHEKKSGGDGRAKAYQHMWQHIAETLGKQPDTLLNDVRAMNSVEYLRASRRLVEAWVYYKRFAVSILGVKAGEGDRD
jgi:CRISPR-associated protein Cmr5